MTEPILHRWDPLKETEWNNLLRATTNFDIKGYSVLTISVSVDVSHYRARYTHEMLFRDGESVFNIGYIYSESIGPMVFELSEI